MGSIITLGIDSIVIDSGKNDFFADHSPLFLPTDIRSVSYYYADDIVEKKDGLARKISSVKRRLDLLGYSITEIEERYEAYCNSQQKYYSQQPVTFDTYRALVSDLDVVSIAQDGNVMDYDFINIISYNLYNDTTVKQHLPEDFESYSDLTEYFRNLDLYIPLRLFAENKKNSNYYLEWGYADVVDGGWVNVDDVVKPLPDSSRILIITEGSSDAMIIAKGLKALHSDIADFFYFIDMEEHYPFTGVGSLYNFCSGLSNIKIQNKVLVIFDNDAAGLEKYIEAKDINTPENMHISRLPDHDDFNSFRTVGPNGFSDANINGSAVAIECFLDMRALSDNQRRIRWTSYNRKLKRYQGELEGKDKLLKGFEKANLTNGSYDTSKLEYLLEFLIDDWVSREM